LGFYSSALTPFGLLLDDHTSSVPSAEVILRISPIALRRPPADPLAPVHVSLGFFRPTLCLNPPFSHSVHGIGGERFFSTPVWSVPPTAPSPPPPRNSQGFSSFFSFLLPKRVRVLDNKRTVRFGSPVFFPQNHADFSTIKGKIPAFSVSVAPHPFFRPTSPFPFACVCKPVHDELQVAYPSDASFFFSNPLVLPTPNSEPLPRGVSGFRKVRPAKLRPV